MGDAFDTWTTPKTKKFWLGDPKMLPAHMKDSRILTYGYNADMYAICGNTSSDRIMQHAHTLIAELVANRQVSHEIEHLSRCKLTTYSLKMPLSDLLFLYAIHWVVLSSKG
jgi:hypothetical protein